MNCLLKDVSTECIAASLLELSELSLVTGLDYVDPWLVFVHRVEDEIAELVQTVVGDLELLKGDYLFLPHCPRGRGIRVYVESPRRGGLCLASDNPLRVVELVSVVCNWHYIQCYDILCLWLQVCHTYFDDWEHFPASLGDDHLSGRLVELCPEISVVEDDLHSIPGN